MAPRTTTAIGRIRSTTDESGHSPTNCSRRRRDVRSLARKSRERARLCVSASRSIRVRQIPGSSRRASIVARSDRDPRTPPEAVARAALRDRTGRRRRRRCAQRRRCSFERAGHHDAGRRAGARRPPPARRPHSRTGARGATATEARPGLRRGSEAPRKIPFWAMATLSLMPVWGVHVRPRRHRTTRGGRRSARRSAPRSTAAARAATVATAAAASATRSPAARS